MRPETKEKIAVVKRLHKQGMSIAQACKQAKLGQPTYYEWAKKAGKVSRKQQVIDLPVQQFAKEQLGLIIGSPAQLVSLLKAMQ